MLTVFALLKLSFRESKRTHGGPTTDRERELSRDITMSASGSSESFLEDVKDLGVLYASRRSVGTGSDVIRAVAGTGKVRSGAGSRSPSRSGSPSKAAAAQTSGGGGVDANSSLGLSRSKQHVICGHSDPFMPSLNAKSLEMETVSRAEAAARLHKHHEGCYHSGCEFSFRPAVNQAPFERDPHVHDALYADALALAERKAQQRSEALASLAKVCTFKPAVNAPLRTADESGNAASVVERTLAWNADASEKTEAQRAALAAQREAAEARDCTFNPAINPFDSDVFREQARLMQEKAEREKELAERRQERLRLHEAKRSGEPAKPLAPPIERAELAIQPPVPFRQAHFALTETDNPEQRAESKAKISVAEVICPYCGCRTERLSYSAIGKYRDVGTQVRRRSARATVETQTSMGTNHERVIEALEQKLNALTAELAERDRTIAALQAELKSSQTSTRHAEQRATQLKTTVAELEAALQQSLNASRATVQEIIREVHVERVGVAVATQTEPPAPAAAAPAVEPSPAATASASEALSEKTYRQKMRAAQKDVTVVLSKVKEGLGDVFKMKAALLLAKDVLKRIQQLLRDLMQTQLQDDKRVQLEELAVRIATLTEELEHESRLLAQNPGDQGVADQLTATLKALEDTVEFALEEGVNFAVKVDLAEVMAKVPMFGGVSQGAFFTLLIRKMREHIWPPGKFIVRCNEPGASMFFITKGTVDVLLEGGVCVANLMEGSFFGEIAILLKRPRTASIRAQNYVTTFELDQSVLEDALKQYPHLRHHFHKVAVERLLRIEQRNQKQQLIDRLRSIAMYPFRADLLTLRTTFREIFPSGREGYVDAKDLQKWHKHRRTLTTLLESICARLDDVVWIRESLQQALAEWSAASAAVATSNVVTDVLGLANEAVLAGFRAIALREAHEFLRQLPMFRDAPVDFFAQLSRRMDVLELSKGQELINAQSRDFHMYFVTRGQVQFMTGSHSGSLFVENESFNEMIFATGADPCSDTVVALAESELVRISHAKLVAVFASFPAVKATLDAYCENQRTQSAIAESHTSGIVKATDKFKSLAAKSHKKKVAALLAPEEIAKFGIVKADLLDQFSFDELSLVHHSVATLLDELTAALSAAKRRG